MPSVNLIGQKFGRWTVIEKAPVKGKKQFIGNVSVIVAQLETLEDHHCAMEKVSLVAVIKKIFGLKI